MHAYCLTCILPMRFCPCLLWFVSITACACLALSGVETKPTSGKRITLVVAWWGAGMRAEPGAPGTGPCRKGPHLGAAAYCLATAHVQADAASTADLQQHPDKTLPPDSASGDCQAVHCTPAPLVEPVWQCINGPNSGSVVLGLPAAKRRKLDVDALHSGTVQLQTEQKAPGDKFTHPLGSQADLHSKPGLRPTSTAHGHLSPSRADSDLSSGSDSISGGSASSKDASHVKQSRLAGKENEDLGQSAVGHDDLGSIQAHAEDLFQHPQLLLPIPPLRFFLRTADEISSTYLPPSNNTED